MAICSWCGKDMSLEETISCSENVKVDFGDMVADPIRYGHDTRFGFSYFSTTQRCHDCNIKIGGIHHPGCDMEECPKCHGQLISCGCITEKGEESGERG